MTRKYQRLWVAVALLWILVIPSAGVFFFAANREWWILAYEQACGLVSVGLLGAYVVRSGRRRLDLLYLFLGFFCSTIGDLCTSCDLLFDLGQQSAVVATGLSSYMLGAAAITAAVWMRYWRKASWSSYLAAAALLVVLCTLQLNFILLPFQDAGSPLGMPSRATYSIFRFAQCLNVALLVPLTMRSRDRLEHLFLQGILLLHTAGFSVNYQETTGWPAWPAALGTIAVCLVASAAKQSSFLDQEPILSEDKSVRTGVSALVALVSILIVGFLIVSKIVVVSSGARLTELMLMLFGCWCAANFLALAVSEDVEALSKAMPRAVCGEPNAPLLSKVTRITMFAEIRGLVCGYNALVEKANGLSKYVAEKEREIAIGAAAYQIAHDIRSPIAALQYVQTHTNTLSDECQELFRASTDRITEIAESLLQQYRSSTGAKNDESSEPLAIRLVPLIESIVREKRVVFAENSVDLRFQVDEEAAAIAATVQASDFKRSIANLLQNGFEACPANGTVTVKLGADSRIAQICIEDTGCGIHPDNLVKVMKPGGSLNKKEGCGLGLSSAVRNVEIWGGTLTIDSQVGVGTCITIRLPALPLETRPVRSA